MAMRIRLRGATRARITNELRAGAELGNLQFFKRAKAILLVADGKTSVEIAGLLEVDPRTVYNWICAWLLGGLAWLRRFRWPPRGRKSKLSKAQKRKLHAIIDAGPEKSGFACGCWNAAMVAEVIFTRFGVTYSVKYLPALLKKIGLSFQKAAFVSDHLDEEKRAEWKNVTWPKILRRAKRLGADIFFGDEVSFAQWGSLGRTWAPIGKQPKIKTTGKRKALKMFGAIELFSGKFRYMETEKKFNGASYIEFLKVLVRNARRPVILIEDGAPYHRSKEVKAFKKQMQERGRMFTYRLPSYSPDYNPIEKLWKKAKKDATHCRYFPTFESLREAVVAAFAKYMKEAKQVIAVMTKLREEAGVAHE